MINNCSHAKVGYLIQNADVTEICDVCNDIECIESHKLILKEELKEFASSTIPLLQDCFQCLYESLPQAIDNLKQTLQYIYQGFIENTTKTEYQEMIDILENKENKYLPQLVDFYSKRTYIRGLQEKLNEATNFVNSVQKFNQQFIITDTQASRTNNKFTKFRINHLKKEEQLIQSISAPEFNKTKVESVNLYEIPTKFKFKHLYSATWLNDKHIGLAAGEYHPYIIYDPFKKFVQQQIIEDKNGVYDSIVVNEKTIVLAYVHGIKLFLYQDQKYQDSCQEFERCEGTPSKLYYCKSTNSVFSSDSYFNYILPINYINRWSLSTGKLTKYKLNGKAYGHLCLTGSLFCVSTFLESEKNSRTKRQNFIYFWNYEKQESDRKIDTKHCIRGLTVQRNSLICFSDEIQIWNLHTLAKQATFRYPEEKFAPHSIIFMTQFCVIGCENGSIWICNSQFQEWEKILKMNAKSMKISEIQERLVISAYNCSFCVLQLKK